MARPFVRWVRSGMGDCRGVTRGVIRGVRHGDADGVRSWTRLRRRRGAWTRALPVPSSNSEVCICTGSGCISKSLSSLWLGESSGTEDKRRTSIMPALSARCTSEVATLKHGDEARRLPSSRLLTYDVGVGNPCSLERNEDQLSACCKVSP